MATLKDIAKACNVSVTSVSLVLNNKPNRISKKTIEKIKNAAEELGYMANKSAIGLVKGITNVIGLIIPDLQNQYFSDLVSRIESILSAAGYNLMIGHSHDNAIKEINLVKSFYSYNIDGLILIISSNHSEETYSNLNEYLTKVDKPVVYIDRKMPDMQFPCFLTNDRYGGYIATKHLLSLGHRTIGCLTGPLNIESAYERYLGYLDALNEFNINVNQKLCFEGDYYVDSGFISFPYFIKQSVTAIFSANDVMAFGLFRSAYESNVSIPEDISVIGFDNNFSCKFTNPPLTSVEQSTDEISKNSTQWLIRKINNINTNSNAITTYLPKIKYRYSTAPPSK